MPPRHSPPRSTKNPEYHDDLRRGTDYFAVLGVPETATHAEILSAFRTRIRAVHPDLNDGKGDRETLELLVRARQMLTGPDRVAYLDARAHRAAAASPPPSRPRSSAPPKPDEPHLDFSEVFRRARAAQRRQPAPPAPASRRTVHDDAVSEGARQAEAVRNQVRQTVRPSVDIPDTASRVDQPRPWSDPPSRVPGQQVPRPERPHFTMPHFTMPHYERPSYRRPVYRPTPAPATPRDTGGG